LQDFAAYTLGGTWRGGDYDEVWVDSTQSVKYFGRYVAIKYLELLRRMVRPELELQDVRIASGAWSVREGLSLIYPQTLPWMADRTDNANSTIRAAETWATTLQIQVLLCEFKQWTNGTFYPGVSHDEELEFARRVETQFAIPEFWEARKALFPESVLGEVGGWDGRRKDKYRG
jgi:hypothetical protein